jgi:hypothetical protein
MRKIDIFHKNRQKNLGDEMIKYTGRQALDARIVIGAMIIKEK